MCGREEWTRVLCALRDKVYSSPPGQNGRHLSQATILNACFLNWIFGILIRISLKFVPGCTIDNKSAWVEVMAWHRTDDKLLSCWPISLTRVCGTGGSSGNGLPSNRRQVLMGSIYTAPLSPPHNGKTYSIMIYFDTEQPTSNGAYSYTLMIKIQDYRQCFGAAHLECWGTFGGNLKARVCVYRVFQMTGCLVEVLLASFGRNWFQCGSDEYQLSELASGEE